MQDYQGVRDMAEETKPSNCLCNFPEVKEPTASGHNAGCSAHKQWLIDNPAKASKFRSTKMQAGEE